MRVNLKADLVAVRGLSGTLVATAMSTLFSTPIAVVRKPGENSHGREVEVVEYNDEGNLRYNNYIIVDDLISSGKTIQAIVDALKSQIPYALHGKCVAIALYLQGEEGIELSSWRVNNGDEIPVFNIEDV